MRITDVEIRREPLPLSRPYTIATRRVEAVDLFFVVLRTKSGRRGLGSGSPAAHVTGETEADCAAALERGASALRGRDGRHTGSLAATVAAVTAGAPAARAALDMALWDLLGRHLGVPLVDLLGRRHEALPTSITIGIKPLDETLAEAAEYVGRGFRHLKVKVGLDLDGDLERLHRLRESTPPGTALRVDANQGYDVAGARRFLRATADLDLELVEQPLPAADLQGLRELQASVLPSDPPLAADESCLAEADAFRLLAPPAACSVLNIKLMKCGGVTPGLGIAKVAETAGVGLMWGCMDESAISIAAALHAAYAAPTTRFVDLDGSFDLARDLATGGFRVADGRLHLTDAPGLGVDLAD